MKTYGIKATTLTPYAYHALMVQGGSATLPELISDRALAFGLASTLGMLRASVALPEKDYRTHLAAPPFRTSVLTNHDPKLLPPLLRRLNLEEEAGYKQKTQLVSKKGNLATFHQIQEVPPGQVFHGAIFGFNPFQETGQTRLVIRIGLHRNGMVLLEPDEQVTAVVLNAATADLFGQVLPVARYCLHGLQLTPEMSMREAAGKVAEWN
ncbi:hypothetical protein [Candidatus Venteria ishoeyi]|uniref:Uncharacterized protein n=1 Tax=Candidatus Venteria ishoeyi TaxID=1899563 RepID=A0A1H6FCW6_9GAMM|nr:hypothetical protein [Candidatus Venteria ishoeyi]SEH07169.1 Uncharacterised protein [Candidatus Venteria ishoeyi]